MTNDCTICRKPIVLVPSAAERSAKDKSGRPASFYLALFTAHAECQLEQRRKDTSDLMRRLNSRGA